MLSASLNKTFPSFVPEFANSVITLTERDKPVDPDIIDVKLKAEMKALCVAISSEEKLVTDIRIQGTFAFTQCDLVLTPGEPR